MIEGSGSRSISLTNGPRCRSGRLKSQNHIRIRNIGIHSYRKSLQLYIKPEIFFIFFICRSFLFPGFWSRFTDPITFGFYYLGRLMLVHISFEACCECCYSSSDKVPYSALIGTKVFLGSMSRDVHSCTHWLRPHNSEAAVWALPGSLLIQIL